MAIVGLYHTLLARVCAQLPQERITRLRTLAWLMSGLVYSRSVHLSAMANHLPGLSKKLSKVKRLERWLDNGGVRVRRWYAPVAQDLLRRVSQSQGGIRLVLDGTKVSQHHQLLMVAVLYRRRALPIAWTWLRSGKGHSSGAVQQALMTYVYQLVPTAVTVMVMGDSEFTPVQSLLQAWGWSYALRQKGSYLVRTQPDAPWQRCDTLVQHPGECRWFTEVQLTHKHQLTCNFLAYWQPGEKVPWLLATDLPTPTATIQHYRRRMWIEEMFGDFKAHGFDLEASYLRHFLRLSRLTLAVALLYVALFAFGLKTIKAGDRHLVDRHDRRDLSIFRIGLDMLYWRLGNALPCHIPTCPSLT